VAESAQQVPSSVRAAGAREAGAGECYGVSGEARRWQRQRVRKVQ